MRSSKTYLQFTAPSSTICHARFMFTGLDDCPADHLLALPVVAAVEADEALARLAILPLLLNPVADGLGVALGADSRDRK